MIESKFFWEVFTASWTVVNLNSLDHGPAHWARVERNGRALAAETEGADLLVVEFFALFHDSMRETEWHDPEHGARGANLALDLGVKDVMTPIQWLVFCVACELHDAGEVSDNPTMGVCWDADRLDLPRVGIRPDSQYFSTEAGKRAAVTF